ncbi:hypothetical protein DV113_000548 [Geotrichum candidum]|uniref:Similar to Saccharomyces cerevisiae YML054C CYB2 Cytochrome b2 (L-lactate cytochrome-c oxidoreductase) n=1 Tax=Geotrichum candidum TaxID=1173061 RepID=A0A0J9XE79_GEOCN|nr:hypothetical protein DV113_000548 [Geotrichum candidum]KAI8132423.1 hypothetical protein DUD61_003906 [Geotrichum candidum]CDO55606.1 similar to Saccharomyces cerevisiae YML054C CYB2 Cytochrome b2 (L-lactate cytochrome-c oxidoreductase) [Geotrichum candidum]
MSKIDEPQTLADLEKLALSSTNYMNSSYWTTGSERDITLSNNFSAFDVYTIKPRVLVDVSTCDLSWNGWSLPVGYAPSGSQGLAHADGELATARAARAKNIPMVLSSYSSQALEDVVEAAGNQAPEFLQLYIFRDRKTTAEFVERAYRAGVKALLVTVDTPVLGKRPKLVKSKYKLPNHLDYGNFRGTPNAVRDPIQLINDKLELGKDTTETLSQNELDASLTWEDISWLKSITKGKMEIWLKGILTAEDTIKAIENGGVDGIWVSNHGGRQLDSAPGTLDMLPEIVHAARVIKGKTPKEFGIHIDGGVRTGSDIFKAIALGADFVWVGRPVIYGLSYDGQRGVELMTDILANELRITMQLSGVTHIKDIGPEYLLTWGPRFFPLKSNL